ncbi:MAG: type II toxin-antitoxin system HipA family toxin [Proteobacteria bacterium]|nr:MAG: type II toxin-antitoxin system HipA family toxin [Pseudomonadota bacterium]
MQHHDRLKVTLWNQVVGYLVTLDNGAVAFEYEDDFKRSRLEISPFELPVDTTTIYQSKESSSTFQRLPGIFADCLPDQYGRSVINAFYQQKFGWDQRTLNPLDYLSYLSDRSIGSLQFEPSEPTLATVAEKLEIGELMLAARNTLEGKIEDVLPDILRISASAGGRQAKAIIAYNPASQDIRSGFATAKENFVPCILKFDGVRDGEEANFYGRLEYVYAEMARQAGIVVPKTYLLETEGEFGPAAHFLVERFDRNHALEKTRHYASLCGLTLADFKEKHSTTYENYFAVVRALTQDASQVEESFLRALFNIVFRNQDDHSKNFGFLMDGNGSWRLSPAFDLNYVYGRGDSSTHQMKFAGKDDEFDREDIRRVGKFLGLRPRKIEELLARCSEVASSFIGLCLENGIDRSFADGVLKRFRKI